MDGWLLVLLPPMDRASDDDLSWVVDCRRWVTISEGFFRYFSQKFAFSIPMLLYNVIKDEGWKNLYIFIDPKTTYRRILNLIGQDTKFPNSTYYYNKDNGECTSTIRHLT